MSINNEYEVSTSSIFQGCVSEIFRVSYPIDPIPVPMGHVCIIVGMGWLSRIGLMIDCEEQWFLV